MRVNTNVIVSAYTGTLVCEPDELAAFLSYVCGYKIEKTNHRAMVNAVQICHAWLEYKMRWLKKINVKDCTKDNWETWTGNIAQEFGSRHNVMPIPAEWWEKLAGKMNMEIANELRRLRIASKAATSLN